MDLIELACCIDPRAEASYRAPHLRLIADKLEAVERGEIRRLYITCPPRHWKSSLCSEKFPVWYLGKHPERSIIASGHTLRLVENFSRTTRDTILYNKVFQGLFPKTRLRPDAQGVGEWLTTSGYRTSYRAVGTGAGISGAGADLIIIDDPIADFEQANSRNEREKIWQWYQNTLRERLDPGGAIVLIMSRWNEDDLAGRLLRASANGDGEHWEVLHLPALNPEGTALWPSRWPAEQLEEIRKAIGSRAFAAKFQGTPRQEEGSILDSRKLVMVNESEVPRLLRIVRRWDLAFSERHGADSLAGAKLGVTADGDRYILHINQVRGRWPQGKREIIAQAKTDGPDVIVAIEANGTQLGYYQDVKEHPEMQGFVIVPDEPIGSKEMRASVWGSRLDDGKIKCVRGPWNQAFFDEIDAFPNADHDDSVDAVSGAWAQLATTTLTPDAIVIGYPQNFLRRQMPLFWPRGYV